MIGKRLCRSFIRLRLLALCLSTTRALAGALLRGGRNLPVEQLLLVRLPLPLRNDRPVEATKPSIKLATGRNEGNEDKAVRRRKEATRRKGRRIILSSTLKMVDLDDGLHEIGLCTSTRWSPGTWYAAIGVPSGSCQ